MSSEEDTYWDKNKATVFSFYITNLKITKCCKDFDQFKAISFKHKAKYNYTIENFYDNSVKKLLKVSSICSQGAWY